jgi:hypothetical protein
MSARQVQTSSISVGIIVHSPYLKFTWFQGKERYQQDATNQCLFLSWPWSCGAGARAAGTPDPPDHGQHNQC